MENTLLEAAIAGIAPEATVTAGKQFVEVTVSPDHLKSVISKLKENSETSFDLLVCLTGMDYGSDLGVVYHLRSTSHNHMTVVRTRCSDRLNPAVDSLCDIYKGAEYHEREAFDLLGISFTGHPDLRRLFLEASAGFPLRKDYSDDINIVSK